MRPQASSAIMFSFLLGGFAQIRAEVVPDGIMPKRQVVGTGATTSTPATTDTPTTSDAPTSDPTTADPTTAAPTTADPTTAAPTTDATSPTTAAAGTTPTTTAAAATTQQTQQTSDPSTDATPASPPSEQSSTSVPTTIAVTTTNADGSTVTSSISTNTLAAITSATGKNAKSSSTTAGVEDDKSIVKTDSTNTAIVAIGSRTINRSTLSRETVITSALLAKATSEHVYTSTWTSDGQVYSSVVTEDRIYSSTTGFATATIEPALANGGGDGSNLSDNAKRVIGGVVGGIGGAILIGGLAFVGWRLWGKKKAAREQEDEVWGNAGSRPDSIETAKRSSGMGAYRPEQHYANPNGAINASSNF